MSRYIVMTSVAQVKGNARRYGRYKNVAVVEIEGDVWPKMISPRAKGVIAVIHQWKGQYEGSTDRCQYRRALAKAYALAHDLNHPGLPVMLRPAA